MHMKLAALAGVFMLAGCSTSGPTHDGGPTPDADGVPCSDSEGKSAVYIDVEYSTPPDSECTVDWGTTITWRAKAGAEEFELQFTDASPAARGAPRQVFSRLQAGRQKIVFTAHNVSGTYNYDIRTAEGGVDPAIIIRARVR